MQKQEVSAGNCVIRARDSRFITIEQNGHTFRYEYKQSENARYIVAWKTMLNYKQEKSNQVCLIENDKNILWTEEFRRAWSCDVSNDGTVAVKDLNPVQYPNRKGQVGYVFLHSIVVISGNGRRLKFDFGQDAEIIAFALSPDGGFLVYNLQRYRPDNYRLVLHDLQSNKEEWRYKYPQDQVIHEVAFKGQRILAYSASRPSAYVDRRYSFTLDLAGKLTEDDITEKQKQEENDAAAASASGAADKVIQILVANLVEVAPTIEANKRTQIGTKIASPAWSSIMKGQHPFPALYVVVSPVMTKSRFQEVNSNPKEKAHRFHLNINVFARSSDERDKTVEKCLATLAQKDEEFRKNRLVITSAPLPMIVPSYPGSSSYSRATIGAMVAFPSTSAASYMTSEKGLVRSSVTTEGNRVRINLTLDKAALEALRKRRQRLGKDESATNEVDEGGLYGHLDDGDS